MENGTNISEELRLAELKKETLRRSFDLVHAQANSVLLFTLQWKDLEQHFDLTMKSLEKQTAEVDINKKLLDQRAKEIEVKEAELGLVQTKIEECSRELQSKEEQLGLLEKKIEECSERLESKGKKLGLVQAKIEECNGAVESKEEQLVLVKKRVEECTCELQLKKSELNLVSKSVEDLCEKLSLKKEEVNLVEEAIEKCRGELKQLELMRDLIKDCSKQLELKYMELREVENLIKECEKAYVIKEQHIASFQRLIEDYAEEIEAKEKLLDAIKRSIGDCDAELKSKKKELELTETTISEQLAELHSEEKKLESLQKRVIHRKKELELKEAELDSVKEQMKEYYDDLELKEREFNGIRICIEERTRELTVKEEQLKSTQKSIEECSKEFEVKREKFISIEKSIVKLSGELELKKNQLYLIQNSVKELTEERESEELRLDLIESISTGCLRELKEKEKHFDLLKKSSEERLQDLEVKERQFEENVKEFELKERQFDSARKAVENYSKEVELKDKRLADILHSQIMTDLTAIDTTGQLSPSLQSYITRDGRNLQLLLNQHLKKHDLVCGEISTALKTVDDPAKLVLDAMQGFYSLNSKEGDLEFDASIIRRSCILLLDQLLIVSPQINPQVQNEAMKLAGEWKTKLRLATENSLEVLGFLQLLAAFRLASAYDRNELQCLLDIVAQHRQTPKLRQALGISDQVPAHILPSHVKTEPSESSTINNALNSLSASVQLSTVTERRSLHLFLTEQLNKHDLMLEEVSSALHMSLDPAKFVLDLIQGSYSTHEKRQGTGFEGVLRNYILFLEQLKKLSPKINPQVKAEAMKLAVEWKTKIGAVTVNSLEVLVFLHLLATYELVACFNGAEILELLRTIAQHKKAPEICRDLGFADMVPEISTGRGTFRDPGINAFSSPFRVTVFVSNLIGKKRYIEAVRFICAFELMDKFPPEAILREYLEHIKKSALTICQEGNNSPNAKDKATDFELAALRILTECIEDCKIEYLLLFENIKNYIAKLENWKADRRHTAPVHNPRFQLQMQNVNACTPTNQPGPGSMFQSQQIGNNHGLSSSTPRDQMPQQNHYKRPRTDPPTITSYAARVPVPINHYMSSSAGPRMPSNLRGATNLGAGQSDVGRKHKFNHLQLNYF